VSFQLADAERLPFDDCFDAILYECAFCTFPDKRTAAQGLPVSSSLQGGWALAILRSASRARRITAWIAGIGDAQPLDSYSNWLMDTGFSVILAEERNAWLQQMVQQIGDRQLCNTQVVESFDLSALNGPAVGNIAPDRCVRWLAAFHRSGKVDLESIGQRFFDSL
jgi:hypothetical protein